MPSPRLIYNYTGHPSRVLPRINARRTVDTVTEIYAVEIIGSQPRPHAIPVLKGGAVTAETGKAGTGAAATDRLLKHSHLSYRSEARTKQHKGESVARTGVPDRPGGFGCVPRTPGPYRA